MIQGKYKKTPIDFSIYTVQKFPLTLFTSSLASHWGCGANTLGTLTGIHPAKILTQNKLRRHTSDRFIVSFLKKNGFTVIPLTQCELSNCIKYSEKITSRHIILLSSVFLKNEASWVIVYDDYFVHNQQIKDLNTLEFINHPILTAYVVLKAGWH